MYTIRLISLNILIQVSVLQCDQYELALAFNSELVYPRTTKNRSIWSKSNNLSYYRI